MNTKMLTVTALAALLAGPAFAQTATPPSAAPSTPSTTTPSTTTPSAATPSTSNMPSSASSTMPSSATGSAAFIESQKQEQWLASNLIGTKVRGSGDENLGEVNDVLLDRNGAVVGAVIGVGGFLGVGEKDVAVPFNALELVRNTNGDSLVLRKSKDELKAAPEFKEYTASSSASTGGTAGAPATKAPPAR
ncbi:PRC-barrel domain-containing protein [Roseixanthobacter glucoisosaccharinicivorans]|uniref:PRC-barrel domain-containing protein n=1 Tax=Roseixanthobacter glucoisosaccharinicivorans TaxID=3119923 RepID=UPI003726A0EA